MKDQPSFRRLACLYLDAYCADHVQAEALTDAQVTHARTLFHTFLAAIDTPVIVTPDPLHDIAPRHGLCDLANLKLFVAQFARAYLGCSHSRKRL